MYATYVGGSSDIGFDIAIDSQNCVYITGETGGSDFSMTKTLNGEPAPGYDQSYNGKGDVFVVKLNPQGTQLEYATYLGGSITDRGCAISVDTEGYAYIAGETVSSDFSMTKTLNGEPAPGYDQSYNGNRDENQPHMQDIFVVRLNPQGTELTYATYLGGNQDEYLHSMTIDPQNCIYITGETTSSDFSMTKTLDGEPAPGYDQSYNGKGDAFVVKLNPQGTQLEYATYLGGNELDASFAITLDSMQCTYITGWTKSSDFSMVQANKGEKTCGYDQSFNGSIDAFVIKLNPQGTQLEYATYLGGISRDSGRDITVDLQNCIYIAGWTESRNFPMTKTLNGDPAPGYDQTCNKEGWSEAFIVKIQPST